MLRQDVYEAINTEREFQDRKWGSVQKHPHEVGGWILIMEQLLADARKAWASSKADTDALEEIRKVVAPLEEIRKVVAVGVACGEQHGLPKRAK